MTRTWRGFDGLAGDTLWSGLHDGLALLSSMASFYLITRALPTERYGGYVGLYGLLGAIGAFSYSGVGLAALHRLIGERDDPDDTLRSFLSLTVMTGAVLSALAIGLSLAFLRLGAVEISLIVVAELLGPAVIFISALLIQGVSGFAASIRVKLGVVAIRLASVLLLHFTGHLTLPALGLTILASFTVYGVWILAVHLPRHGYAVSFGWPNGLSLRSSGVFSVPMVASKLQTDADKFLLNAFGFRAEAGVYGAAYRIVLLGLTPLGSLDNAAFQRFLPRGEPGEIGAHWRRSTRLAMLMATASVVVALGLWICLPLFHFLIEDRYNEAFDIVPWLLFTVPLLATSNLALNGLLGLGRPTTRMYVTIASSVISMVSYLLLIPSNGWKGAVAATYISEVALAVIAWSTLWHYQRRADDEVRRVASPPVSTGQRG
ncbi:MAG: lipopolysaccharide biosynthesis protein [Acidimicrobiales bacterium]